MVRDFTSYICREVPFQSFFEGGEGGEGGSANLGYSLHVEYAIYAKNIMANVYNLDLYVSNIIFIYVWI